MNIYKYNFIQEILSNPKLNPDQRGRIALLTSKELKSDFIKSENLEKRIINIENKLKIESSNDGNKINDLKIQEIYPGDFEKIDLSEFNDYPDIDLEENSLQKDLMLTKKYLNPINTYKYLIEFNKNQMLKTTCHELDEYDLTPIMEYCNIQQYDIFKHYSALIEEFNKHNKKFKASTYLISMFRGFLTGKDYYGKDLPNGWSSDQISCSWVSKEILDWSNKYKLPPNSSAILLENKKIVLPCELNTSIKTVNSNLIQNFRELTLHFKSLFHLRYEKSLKLLLENINQKRAYNEKINFIISEEDFPVHIELFIDVDKILQAYSILIEMALKQNNGPEKPLIKLSLYEVEGKIYFTIHHLNNKFNKSISNSLGRIGLTFENLIQYQMNGNCNFYLKADFREEGFGEINLWNGLVPSCKPIIGNSFAGGVEYILEFPIR